MQGVLEVSFPATPCPATPPVWQHRCLHGWHMHFWGMQRLNGFVAASRGLLSAPVALCQSCLHGWHRSTTQADAELQGALWLPRWC
jgi:hypothetical protein